MLFKEIITVYSENHVSRLCKTGSCYSSVRFVSTLSCRSRKIRSEPNVSTHFKPVIDTSTSFVALRWERMQRVEFSLVDNLNVPLQCCCSSLRSLHPLNQPYQTNAAQDTGRPKISFHKIVSHVSTRVPTKFTKFMMMMMMFLAATQCGLVGRYEHFGGIY
jgi:hypothetical protein